MFDHTAPASFAFALRLALAAACVGHTLALGDEPKPSAGRVLTIEEAIDVAKRCIIDGNIRVAGSFIESARYERKSDGEDGPVWRITWARHRELKGGQVFVTVFPGRTCRVTYGE